MSEEKLQAKFTILDSKNIFKLSLRKSQADTYLKTKT